MIFPAVWRHGARVQVVGLHVDCFKIPWQRVLHGHHNVDHLLPLRRQVPFKQSFATLSSMSFIGLRSELPWSTCFEEWNTKDCYTRDLAEDCNSNSSINTFYNFGCVSKDLYCYAHDYSGGWNQQTGMDRERDQRQVPMTNLDPSVQLSCAANGQHKYSLHKGGGRVNEEQW